MAKKFRDFESAREFVRKLNLKNKLEWDIYSKNSRPLDIPSNPMLTYKKDWKGYGDWLGTGNVSSYNKLFRDFESAREFVRKLNITNSSDWIAYRKSGNKPDDIPSNPMLTYKKDWKGWGDFFGTGRTRNTIFRDFESAREFARSLKLKTRVEFQEYVRKYNPVDIPNAPNITYKDKGWVSWGDWLGTGRIGRNTIFRDFESAREFARSLNLKNQTEWFGFCKSGNKPDDIPSSPKQTYKDKGWKGYGDWLGTGNVRGTQFRNFESAREFARSLNLKNQTEWFGFCKSGNKPDDIPSSPDVFYKKDWKGMGDWLGTGNISSKSKSKMLSFYQAREFARNLGLASYTEWTKYRKSGKRPSNIPANPNKAYSEFQGYPDFLGTDEMKIFVGYNEAKKIIHQFNIKNENEWKMFVKNDKFPNNVPKAPWVTYRDNGWKGMGDWLGTKRIRSTIFRDFESAREYVRNLQLKNVNDWKMYSKSGNKPDDIPTNPNQTYKDKGWKGYGDWLDIEINILPNYLPFNDARKYAREFARKHNIKSQAEWMIAHRQGLIPKNIPLRPWTVYTKKSK